MGFPGKSNLPFHDFFRKDFQTGYAILVTICRKEGPKNQKNVIDL